MEEDYILIEKYFKKQLRPDEINMFNERLKSDLAFKKMFKTEEVLFTSLKILDQKNKFRKEYFQKEGRVIQWPNYFTHPLAIAASISLFFVAGYLIYLNSSSTTDSFIVPIYSASQMGFAGTDKIDEINVKVIKSSKEDTYIFGKELLISVNYEVDRKSVSVSFHQDSETFWLKINNQLFEIKKDNTSHPLK